MVFQLENTISFNYIKRGLKTFLQKKKEDNYSKCRFIISVKCQNSKEEKQNNARVYVPY